MISEILQSFPLTAFAIIAITVVILKLRSSDRMSTLLKKFPGPVKPLIGSILDCNVTNEELSDLVYKFRNTYGERYRVKLGPLNVVVLANPDDIEKLLSSSKNTEKGKTYELIWPWLGAGLLTSKGKQWHSRRKMLTPAFHFKILEDFMVIFNEQSNILVNILREDFKNRKEKDICQYLTTCALDIIGEAAMDRKFNSQRTPDVPYVKAIYKACEVLQYQGLRPWTWIDFIFKWTPLGCEFKTALKTLHDFTDEVIRERKSVERSANEEVTNNTREQVDDIYWHGKRKLAFLDLLIEAQKNPENNLSDRDIREEVDTFMFEGHDTTSASLGWTTFLLGCNPKHQAKVHEELDRVFGDDRVRPITTKDLVELKYLEMCIKESLRLYPSVPFMSRTLTADIELDDEMVIPVGTNVALLSLAIHRNAEIYPDPETFDPERFVPEKVAQRHPFAYIPFSAGPRNCIGQKFAMMEEKVILANLFRNFQVEAAEKIEDVTVMMEVITRPKDGLTVRLSPR